MSVKSSLIGLSEHYMRNAGTGHTELVMRGFRDYPRPAILVVAYDAEKPRFASKDKHVLSLDDVEFGALEGYHLPLVLDNHSMIQLTLGSLQLISAQQEEIDKLTGRLSQIARTASWR